MFSNLVKVARAIAVEHRRTTLRCCHVAFILKRSDIVSIGTNQKKTHPHNLRYRYRVEKTHTCAELLAVLKGKKTNYSGHRMVVIRVDREDNLNNSKPCEGCQHLIESMDFDEVWFTNTEGEFECL